MIDFEHDFAPLRAIGWSPALGPALNDTLSTWAADAAEPGAMPPRLMRLVEVHRDALRLHDGHTEHRARPLPRLARALAADGVELAVGDWLLATPAGSADPGALWVQARLPALNHIVRRDADGRRHAIVSNVDTALFVMGLDADFNLRRLERYLLLVAGAGVQPVVVLTKADLVAPDAAMRAAMVADEIDAVRARVGAAVPVVAVDGTAPEAALRLAPWLLPGRTAVLLGSSGAGKSTLTNTLAARSLQDTGPVRAGDQRGQHTTTSRSLHRLPGGACVIDTPGLRALRPDIDAARLDASFEDIARLAPSCRFRDCRHEEEPGCAVRDGVGGDRVRNYHKLLREARRDTLSVLERRQQLAQWKARGRAGAQRAKLKRGEG